MHDWVPEQGGIIERAQGFGQDGGFLQGWDSLWGVGYL